MIRRMTVESKAMVIEAFDPLLVTDDDEVDDIISLIFKSG